MKSNKWLIPALLFFSVAVYGQQPSGMEVKVQLKPYKNQWIYLAYYYGSIKALADSAFLNADGKGVFKKNEPLPQGVYIVASPGKSILFEMMMGADQQFSVSGDTTQLEASLKFEGSTENEAFIQYTRFLSPIGRRIDSLQKKMEQAPPAEKAGYATQLQKAAGEMVAYRNKVIKEMPDALLSLLFKTMKNVEYPATLLKPKTRKDTIAQYRYGKDHYWDEVDFMDGRLVRTPVFDGKLTDYLENWVSPEPDSLIYEFNWMIALGRNDDEMFKYLIGYFVDHYMYPKMMGQDKVFLHVYQQYLSGEKPAVNWLNEKQMKTIRDRAYMLMANQLGTKAWNMMLPDTAGNLKSMFDLKAKFTVIAFWDVHCGRCREEIPKMDTLYRTRWKKQDVKIYAVMVNESSVPDWAPFIRQHGAGWWHVHEPAAMRAETEKSGQPNFRQLYDMRSTPTLFLLDEEKRIIAKNISLTDMDKLLEQKLSK